MLDANRDGGGSSDLSRSRLRISRQESKDLRPGKWNHNVGKENVNIAVIRLSLSVSLSVCLSVLHLRHFRLFRVTKRDVYFCKESVIVLHFLFLLITLFSNTRKLVKIDSYLNSAKYIHLLMGNLIPELDEGEIFLLDRTPCHRSCAHNTTKFFWWRCYRIEILTTSEPWLKYHRSNMDTNKEKSSLEESMQSWRVVGTHSQRMGSYTCKDGKGFIRFSSQAHWSNYSR